MTPGNPGDFSEEADKCAPPRFPHTIGQELALLGVLTLPYRRGMPTTRNPFETIPAGTNVTWRYRSAIGHGTVVGVHKMGTTADNTMYDVEQHDHHPGEPAIVHHTGKALSKA